MTDPAGGRLDLPEPPEPPGPTESPEPPASEGADGAGAGEPGAAVGEPVTTAPGEAGEPAAADGTDGAEPDTPPDRRPTPASADFRMALVATVTVDLPSQHPTVVLRETESPRRQLSFSVALADGVVLAHALRRVATPRPLTHELLSSIIQGFNIDVVAVRLVGRQGPVYFAEIDLRGKDGRAVYSCRPSDALVVAMLQPVPVPILIDRRLFEEVGDVTPSVTTAPSG